MKLRENSQNMLFVGSSGAGFPALKYACIFKQKALLSNAQFFPKSFWYYEKLDTVLHKHHDTVVEIPCAKHLLTKYGLPKKVIIYSNTCDDEHHEGHAMPFVEHMRQTCSEGSVELRTFSDSGKDTNKLAHCVLWDRPYQEIIKEALFP